MSNSHSFSSSQAARTSPERQFARYVLPSMFTMLLTGFYAIVDGFFIGRATGDVGLAAINIAWPVTAVIIDVYKRQGQHIAVGDFGVGQRHGAGDAVLPGNHFGFAAAADAGAAGDCLLYTSRSKAC